ncbi:peptidoglycan-associated lipoprotein Pal [Pantoea sp. Nvir]|uniref:peptidoglycan-associated lipoprotein Pal n=1 Tax=Pantoea sp. Nvir TaxID=2576760 RepID=UPI00135A5772|nr:peptidoglycan-associated lipoprotein Pal [Pantoea sp. Nvir]MXP66319.1 peptidoglycan-associated lipoprotein Pal [Pantoea sp. Nvir]CAJ0992947.1 Peptidoglycan-associated lipoprotein [Pantoea sp. Nvir]
MQINKVLKGLILTLPILVIVAACSSYKKSNNEQNSMNSNHANGKGANMNSNGLLFSDEQARLQVQQLQQNKIIYFKLDKYNIQSEYAQILDEHAAFLRSNLSYKVTIEGHADERGTPEYNIALGERRANAVKIYLQGKGVSAEQMSIVSYGKEKPDVLGHDETAYSKNRRAVLVY